MSSQHCSTWAHPNTLGSCRDPSRLLNSLSKVDIEQLSKTAGVVIQDGSCISKTLQDGQDIAGL